MTDWAMVVPRWEDSEEPFELAVGFLPLSGFWMLPSFACLLTLWQVSTQYTRLQGQWGHHFWFEEPQSRHQRPFSIYLAWSWIHHGSLHSELFHSNSSSSVKLSRIQPAVISSCSCLKGSPLSSGMHLKSANIYIWLYAQTGLLCTAICTNCIYNL